MGGIFSARRKGAPSITAYDDSRWIALLDAVELPRDKKVAARVMLARKDPAFRQGMLGGRDADEKKATILKCLEEDADVKPDANLAAGLAASLDPRFTTLEEKVDAGNRMSAMVMMGQCRPVSSTSTKDVDKYRKNAITFYYGTQALDATKLKCMATGQELPASEVLAAHIYQQNWPPYLLGAMNKEQHDPTNILLLRSQVEKKFDKFQVTIIPQSEGCFKVVVLDPSLQKDRRGGYIGKGDSGDNMTWDQLNGRLLDLQGCCDGARPARRILALHATLAIAHAEVKGWQEKGVLKVPQAGWESPGYDEHIMLRYLKDLQDQTANLDEE